MKPRIRFVRPYFYGVQCLPVWVCSSIHSTQFGVTPQQAYDAWKDDVPKTAMGRAFRRLSNSLMDILL